jgi:hypothetical protein
MKAYKRHKLGMLMVVAMMGISGTVFASEPQIIASGNASDKVAISSLEKTSLIKMKKDTSVVYGKQQKKRFKRSL